MQIFLILIGVVIVSFIFVKGFGLIHVPKVVALMLFGLFLGAPFLKPVLGEGVETIFNLGDIGLICLMFLAGMETKSSMLKKEFKPSFFVALFGAVFPFLMGFLAAILLNYGIVIAIIVGVCMSISAEATRAKVLMDLKKLKTKIGTLLMEAGLIDDIFGLVIFIVISFVLKQSYLREDLLLVGTILAYLIGVFVQNKLGGRKTINIIEKVMSLILVPFFFASIGLHFDFSTLLVNPLLFVSIIFAAMAGKFIGVFFTKPFTNLKWKQLRLIGWAMNSRGAIGLALAMIAFRTNLIPPEIYSSLVIMALVTTLIFPFAIIRMIKRDKKIMD